VISLIPKRHWAGLMLAVASASAATVTNSNWCLRVWESDEGLPNNNVTSLEQTSDGYIWAASEGRLARFDGATFEPFRSPDIARGYNEQISMLLRSSRGGLWVAMDRGPVIYLDAGKEQVFTNNLPDLMVQSLTEDGERALWVSYYEGVVCRIKDGEVRQFTVQDGLPATGHVCSFTLDRAGRLWFSKGGQIGVLRNQRFETLFTVKNPWSRLGRSSDGSIWICSGYHLYQYDDRRKLREIGAFAAEHPNAGPSVILEDSNGAVWIGTSDSGLFRYDGASFEKVQTSHPRILSLLQDREGNFWVGTAGGGLNYVAERIVGLENTQTGLPFDTVQSLCEATDGALWAVTENGLLVSRVNGAWKTVSTNAAWPTETITCVAANAGGGIWIGTEAQALHRLQGNRLETWGKTEGLTIRSIRSLLVSKSGDVWLGGESALQRFRDGHFTTVPVPPKSSRFRSMTEDTDGNIWAASTKGVLVRVQGDTVTDETAHTRGTAKSIRCLYAAPDGALWIGYSGSGLGRLKNGKFARVTNAQGLYDDHISQIVADDGGWLWFGADHGIFKVWPEVFDDVAEKRDTGFQSLHYGRSEGLPNLQANFDFSPGAVRDRNGRLWIPMRTALAVVNPAKMREDRTAPQVYIHRVLLDERVVARYGGPVPVRGAIDLQDAHAELRLPPGHHRLEFQFTALSFREPENVNFRYRLEGFDDQWIWPGDERTANYSRLSAGHYRFHVAGCNGDGVWNETGISLPVVVLPFMWQTWWFRLGSALAFAVIVGAVVRYVSFRRLRARLQLAQRQAALDKERARIARDIHDDMGSRLTKIVLLSELTLQHPATPEQAGQRAQQVADAARQIMKSLDETVWAINPRNDTLRDLVDYISQFAVQFLQTARIRCRLELPPELPDRNVPADVRHNLFLASKEALTNVVRHARATDTCLRVANSADLLRVTIEDNGQGFDREPVNGDADGLRNMRQRMEEFGGRCEIESRAGAGTRVSFLYVWPRNGDKLNGRFGQPELLGTSG
jgi:ligand-binding sensor domain-containing protein/signal transduction histidine kinase